MASKIIGWAEGANVLPLVKRQAVEECHALSWQRLIGNRRDLAMSSEPGVNGDIDFAS